MKKINNVFRVLGTLCLILFSANVWAGGSDGYFYYYYAKVTAKTASESSAKGYVYVGTSAASVESATDVTSSATGQDPNNYGESTDAPNEAGQVSFFLYAKPASGYKFDGWSTSSTRPNVFESTNPVWETTFGASTTQGSNSTTKPGGTQNSGSTASGDKTQYYSTSTAEYSVYAYFSEVVSDFTVSFAQPSNGSIKVGGESPSSWPYEVSTTTGELTTTLIATPESGYSFWGWYTLNNDGSKNYLSYDSTYDNATFNDAATVYAEFYPSTLPHFQVGGVKFYDLDQASAKAVANGGGTIVVVKDGTLPEGNYSIPSGVTLLVPLNADNQVHTEPSVVTKGTPSRKVYRTLTLANGANITLNGSICVDAIMCLTMGYNGSAMNGYGLIDMKEGSTITMKNGSNFYVWGFVIGDGSIIAESGATIHETFQFKHRGGSALTSIASSNSSKKVFPINQYYIQSIEAPITFRKGATEKVYTGVHNVAEAISIDFIGTSGLFKMTGTNAYLIKKYDVSKDRQNYTLYGDATIGSIKFGMSGFYKESKDFVLPITNNMTLNVESGTTTIQYETAILPDVEVNIASAAKISTSANCYVYDSLNWKGAYAYANDYSKAEAAQIVPVVYRHDGLKYNRKNYKLRDAAINVNGTLEGKIYTTEGGANIFSSLETGSVKFTTALESTTTNQAGQDGTTGKFDAYTVVPARLKQANGDHIATDGLAANTTIIYANGHWGWKGIWVVDDKEYDSAYACTQNALSKSKQDPQPFLKYDEQSEKTYRMVFKKWGDPEVSPEDNEVTYTAEFTKILILNVGGVPQEEAAQQQTEVEEEAQIETQDTLTVNNNESVTMDKTNVGNNGSLTITEGASLESGVTNVTEGGALEVTAGATVTTNATTVTTGGAVTISDNSAVTSTTTNVTGGAVAVSNEATLVTENLSVQNQGEVVVDNNATVTTQNLDVQENSKVTIKNGATVNASTEGNDVVNQTTIAAGAEVEVGESASFHTDEITLNVMQEPVIQKNDQGNEAPEINHNASQVSGNGEVTVKKAYFDFTHKDGFRARTWYAVAVPWEISIPAYANGGVYAKKNDAYVPMQLGSHFDLIHYNGAARARYGNNPETYWYCWRYVEDDIAAGQPAVMTPGKLYMIYLAEATDVIRFEKMEDAAFHYAGEVQTESNHSSDAADANWNGIANPNTYTSDLTYDDAVVGQTYVVTLDAEGNPFGTYVVVDLSKIYVGLPVFVQTTSQPVVKNQAPKRHMLKAQPETAPKIEVQIAPIGLTYSDRIFLQTENGKADTYVIGADVAKAGVSTRFAQMWVNRYDNKLCYNTVAPVNNSAYYPLGISIVRAGDYTISVPAENLNDKVYLTYDNRIIWDLSVAPYELSIEQGVNTRYGIRIIRNNAPAVATDIENVSEEELENGVQKVLMNNQVYVLREGVLYTITGQKAQ